MSLALALALAMAGSRLVSDGAAGGLGDDAIGNFFTGCFVANQRRGLWPAFGGGG